VLLPVHVRRQPNEVTDLSQLPPGVVLLKGWLTLEQQVAVIQECRSVKPLCWQWELDTYFQRDSGQHSWGREGHYLLSQAMPLSWHKVFHDTSHHDVMHTHCCLGVTGSLAWAMAGSTPPAMAQGSRCTSG
jgi:hypothetical protein